LNRRDFLNKAGASAGLFLLPSGLLRGNTVSPDFIGQNEGMDLVLLKRMADFVLQLAQSGGASYADIRFGKTQREQIVGINRLIAPVKYTESFGVGIRVVVDGSVSFISKANVTTEDELAPLIVQATNTARINSKLRKKQVRMAPQEALGQVAWKTPVTKNVFEIPVAEKQELLMAANDAALSKGVNHVESMLYAQKQYKYFASTDGSYIHQEIHRFWPTFCVASGDLAGGDFQTRSALSSPVGRGYEYLQKTPADKVNGIVTRYKNGYDLLEDITLAAEQVKQKVTAKSVESGQYDLVMDPSALWSIVHHTIGNVLDLDRHADENAAEDGTAYLDLEKWKAGDKAFGSRFVSFLADRTQSGTLGATGYDDEGIKSRQWTLVRDGQLETFLSDRRKNQMIDENRSHGCGAAEDWEYPVQLRMPNISLAPGKAPLTVDQLIGDVKKGIYVVGEGSISLDQQCLNFQSGGQLFYEIEDGQIKGMLKDTSFQSNTRDFWNSCSQVCDRRDFRFGGTIADRKGKPAQSHAVSHGCATSRFNGVQVFNTRTF